jgi:O-antigen/teichoic acid export membrane protein
VDILSFILLWTDVIMVGYFRTFQEVGIYSAAQRTALLGILLLGVFTEIFLPLISKFHSEGNREKLEYYFKIITRWCFLLSFPIFIVVIFFAKEILRLFGDKFTIAISSLVVLCIARAINVTVGPVGYLLMMSGRQRVNLFNIICICLLNIILNFYYIPKLGIFGAALSTAISLTILALISSFQVLILLKIHPFNKEFLKSFLIAVFAALVLWIGKINFENRSLLYKGSLVLSFLGGYFFLQSILGFTEEERRIFWNTIRISVVRK